MIFSTPKCHSKVNVNKFDESSFVPIHIFVFISRANFKFVHIAQAHSYHKLCIPTR